MALAVGAKLGPYEILGALGAGGMGEVYRAHDTKLNRDVALKILPESFTHDPERIARFRREAQVLAALNHPHIGAIYGLDETDGQQVLVLELIDGETLADRIAKGALPVDEVLGIAKQIAEALEAAHEKGIIHRDLKPANIALSKNGMVKVLDFGLAKATEAAIGPALDLADSPTLTSPAMMTGVGVILGTAAYMSPEQAKGRAADKRSDIWGFGCVFYEMLTGKRAFQGDDVGDTLATVLKTEPDWRTLPPDTAAPIRRLLRRCLEKDRTRRLDSAADARLEIEDALTAPAAETSDASVTAERAASRRALPWVVAGVALAVSSVVLWPAWRKEPTQPAPLRLSAEIGADAALVSTQGAAAILSPDGQLLAFDALKSGAERSLLYVRRLDQLQATALSGTDGATSPFFSPDGQWIGFFADNKLKKIAVSGGAAVTLCDALSGRGGTWPKTARSSSRHE
jgi:hypothetical protein